MDRPLRNKGQMSPRERLVGLVVALAEFRTTGAVLPANS